MYTRNFYEEEEQISVPKNYDGNAFREDTEEEYNTKNIFSVQKDADTQKSETVSFEPRGDGERGFASAFLGKLPIAPFLSRFDYFKKQRLEFGTEELLIIGIALFLLLSKSGDAICALMLLALLFV